MDSHISGTDQMDHEDKGTTQEKPKSLTNQHNYAKHNGYESKLKSQGLSINRIKHDLKVKLCGCDRECNDHITSETVLRWRLKIHTLPITFVRQQRLLELYRDTLFEDGVNKTKHLCEGDLVCRKAWYSLILGISERAYSRLRKASRDGIQSLLQRSPTKHRGSRGSSAFGYMNYYVSVMGDPSPDGERILLPVGISAKEIFSQYQKHNGEDIIKESQFYVLWKKHFPHVSYQKHCKIAKCNVCMLSRHLLEQKNLPIEAREHVLRDRQEHLLRQQNERKEYYKRRGEAVANPQLVTSVIVDGMDQSKSNLPHFKGWMMPKDCDAQKQLSTHIVGALIHGRGTDMYLDVRQYPHDSNLTINCLMRALITHATDLTLTPTLYIQLDNCGRENKNKFFLSFMALLVARGFVDEITMSFLMVGHTHEDIDAKFSKISTALKRKDAKTIPELMEVIQTSSTASTSPYIMGSVYNIRDWISPFINDIHQTRFPHVYRFFRDRPEHVAITYKNWSTDSNWLPLPSQQPLEIFKLDEQGKQILPSGSPQLVDPVFEGKNIYSDIKSNLARLKVYLSFAQWTWWEEFLKSPSITCQDDVAQPWFLQQLRPIVHAEKNHSDADTENETDASPLATLMDKERNIPCVQTGKKRKLVTPTTPQKKKKDVETGYMVFYVKDGEPYFGKVVKVGISTLEVVLHSGTLMGSWEPIFFGISAAVTTISKDSIDDSCIFYLTATNKLPSNIMAKVKHILTK